MVRGNPLIISGLRARTLPLLAHRALQQRILRNLTFSDEHAARVSHHIATFSSSCDGHAGAIYLLLQKLIWRIVVHNLLLLVLFVSRAGTVGRLHEMKIRYLSTSLHTGFSIAGSLCISSNIF